MQTFLTHAAIALATILLTYAALGSVVLVGIYSLPTAAIIATVALIALMILASNK